MLKHRMYIAIRIALVAIIMQLMACSNTSVSPAKAEAEAFGDLRARVVDVVADEGRRAQILARVDVVQLRYADFRRAVVARKQEFRALNKDYDATREQFDALLNQYATEVESSRELLAQSHRDLLALTTDQEWSSLNKVSSRAIESLISSLQAI